MDNTRTPENTVLEEKAMMSFDEKENMDYLRPPTRSGSASSHSSTDTLPLYEANTNTSAVLSIPSMDFVPGHALNVAAKGIRWLRFPTPSSELEINIYNAVDNTLAYTSRRPEKRSGSAVLSHPNLGELISTTYHFGPGREPEIRFLQPAYSASDEVTPITLNPGDREALKVKSQWTSRTIELTDLEKGRVYEWRYIKSQDPKDKKNKVLALVLKSGASECGYVAKNKKMIAQLRRDDETRTPGTKDSTAGNGGKLILDREATGFLDESLIVATCIMMSKKEIDRRREAQFVMLTGGAGS